MSWGLSEGQSTITNLKNRQCYQMTGNVTTENNGGFIQIRTPINPSIYANEYECISIKVYGNNKDYALHVRTKLTLAPWQYYSYSFLVKDEWEKIKAPFKDFQKSNFYQPKNIQSKY